MLGGGMHSDESLAQQRGTLPMDTRQLDTRVNE